MKTSTTAMIKLMSPKIEVDSQEFIEMIRGMIAKMMGSPSSISALLTIPIGLLSTDSFEATKPPATSPKENNASVKLY